MSRSLRKQASPESFLPVPPATFHILLALAGGDLHGYAIMSTIKDWSGDVLRADEGSLYPALHRMEEAGWIRAKWVAKDSGRRVRIYELRAAGEKRLNAEESRWQVVTAAVNRVLRTV